MMTQDIAIKIEKYTFTHEEKFGWWGPGDWVYEPDRVDFTYRGIKCYIVRACYKEKKYTMQMGHLCGYITIPKDHPWHGKAYEDIDVGVHWGLTFADFNKNEEFEIGFDCAHLYDLIPGTVALMRNIYEKTGESRSVHPDERISYKNVDFCIEQCKSLVDQLLEYKGDKKNGTQSNN